MNQSKTERVLVHAPYGRDAALICRVLERADIPASVCATVEDLCSDLGDDVEAAIISDESLTNNSVAALADVLDAQPPWSDLPLIVTTSGGDATEASRRRLEILEPLGNVSLLERPLRAATLVSAVQTARRARRRQHQLREIFLERERLVRELARSNEDLAQFAHVVSHDLQAPIRMVTCFSEMLAERYKDQMDAAAKEFIGTIQEGAATMERLIRTLLNYATAGQAPLKPAQVRLSAIADAVVTTLRPTIDELHAEICYDDLPTVSGDPILLQQLIQNLVGNALKYRDPGTIPRVRISAQRAGQEWIVSVKDNGPGVAIEHHESIFQPFTRLHGAEIFGTGIGLAVCRKIVKRHGGRIWVESAAGKGATFCFTLPMAPVKKAPQTFIPPAVLV
jgi:signal transduction histidine kinase